MSDYLRTVGNCAKDGKANKRRLAEVIWEEALKGNLAAARLIYEYTEGKPPQRLEHTGREGEDLLPVDKLIALIREVDER